MIGPILKGAAGLLFVLGSIWLVRAEGARYRAQLLAAGPAPLVARLIPEPERIDLAASDRPAGGGPIRDEEPKTVAKASIPRPEIPPETGSPAVEPPPASSPESSATSANPVASLSPAEPTRMPRTTLDPIESSTPLPRESPIPPTRPVAPRLPPIREVEIDKDPRRLTVEEERRIGEAVHEAILGRHRAVEGGPHLSRLRKAARPLLEARERKEVEYTFTVLDAPEAYAFAHLGGFVYATSGLFSLVADEAELQFVIAHEIAHVDRKHGIEQVALALSRPGSAGAGLVQRFYHQVALGYAERQDFEADDWAYQVLLRLGLTPYRARSFLQRLLGYAERHGWEWGRIRPKSGPTDPVQDVANHWPSQPGVADRLERLRGARASSNRPEPGPARRP